MKVDITQCSGCKSNDDVNVCLVFGHKPEKYALNEKNCPKKEK